MSRVKFIEVPTPNGFGYIRVQDDEAATYRLGTNEKGEPFIVCEECGFGSYHLKDIEERYCAKCNMFHNDL